MITYMQNVSDSDRQVAQKFNYRCIICFRRYDVLHHIIPKSLGGGDGEENLVTLCQFHHQEVERLDFFPPKKIPYYTIRPKLYKVN